MRAATVQATGEERLMSPDEMIVSKTDPKGVITYANQAFCRLAAMPEEDLMGQPHNIIRHPEMPRCVFKLLWDTPAAREEVFAYVLNLAADGAHYWVFTHVTPTYDRSGQVIGYHSNRRCPDRQAVTTVTGLYQQLRNEERRHASSPDGLAASTRMLGELLTAQQLSYDEFLWKVTP
jgi:PAS domain S-box-containing protein